MKTLNNALSQAAKGKGNTVILSGEAGIGKTRLLQEFKSLDGVYKNIDSEKIKRELGWEPVVKFEEGILSTIDWYKNALQQSKS